MDKAKSLRLAIGLVVASVVAGALALLLVPRPIAAESVAVGQGPLAESVADQGMVRVREAYVVSAPVSGRLERLDLHVGDPVAAGKTVVARIRPANADPLDPRARAQAEAAVSAALAAHAAASAQQEQSLVEAQKAGVDLQRTRRLADQGFASAQALESATVQDRAAKAAVRTSKAQVSMRLSELAAARAALIGPEAAGSAPISVTAPASGPVTRVLQQSERFVSAGAPLVEISDPAGLEASVEFLSQDAVKIREGMAAQLYDWGGGAPLAAIVRRVEPQGFTKVSALGVEEQRVLVILQRVGDPGSWASLGPGYRVWGRVFLRREALATTVPLGALTRSDGRWAVFKITRGRAILTPVEIGILTDQQAEVRRGLKPGDPVVIFPSDRVRDGVRLKLSGG